LPTIDFSAEAPTGPAIAAAERQRKRRLRRDRLIDDVMKEYRIGGDPIMRLYTWLLARALCQTSERLMRERGKEIVNAASAEKERIA
jgi:hypothetical protein